MANRKEILKMIESAYPGQCFFSQEEAAKIMGYSYGYAKTVLLTSGARPFGGRRAARYSAFDIADAMLNQLGAKRGA